MKDLKTKHLFISLLLCLHFSIPNSQTHTSWHTPEAATPRQFFKIFVLFFQEQPFYNFPEGSICSLNRHRRFFQEGLYYVLRTDKFSRRVLLNRHVFFQRGSVHRTDRPYYLIKQILVFPVTII